MASMTRRKIVGAGLVALGGAALWQIRKIMARRDVETLYAASLAPPDGPLRVYHLGHSLIGRDIPAMVAQLAGAGHNYASQLGWGAALRDHWEPDVPVNGFDVENAHPMFRAATEAVSSGDYDAVVFTEMVELRDALRYHDSAVYLAKWAELAVASNPSVRVYLYETWHHLDDPAGWLTRLDNDLPQLWEAKLAFPAARLAKVPIRIIPAGHVMAAFVRALENAQGVGNVLRREDLFAKDVDGTQDTIHLSDLGNYLVALTHYATLYHQSPVGLPLGLLRADGSAADAPDAAAGALMQRTVWEVVRAYGKSGVSG